MEFLGLIILAIIIDLFLPFLYFIGGWVSGLIIKIIIGSSIVKGLSLIGLHLSLNHLPLFFGTLNVIASFFQHNIKIDKES